MKHFVILLTIVLIGKTSIAQTASDSVKMVINKLFTAMKQADPVMLRSCFADSMILQTISKNKDGLLFVRNEKHSDFIAFISKEQPGNADERIVIETVKVDGPLAIVWAPYDFYYKGQFRHCGVNSFQLVRFNGEWKIQYLIDTRRKEGCKEN